jgi:exonuclease SbcD
MGFSREEEHLKFFEWLLEKIESYKIEVLIVSGDIFDSMTPPNYALKLYYSFLSKLAKTNIAQVVIIAGNHDSISTISAPKEILEILNIRVVASSGEIIHIPEVGIVCAIPFLRDSVIKKFVSKENLEARVEAIQKGVKRHYFEMFQKAKEISKELPIIATGHLTAWNVKNGDGERNIGNLEGLQKDTFPDFDYIALGHIHKFQKVSENIFYSGSPIPITFKEAKYKKFVIVQDLNSKEFQKLEVPKFREILSISTKFENIEEEFLKVPKKSFVELYIEDDFGDAIVERVDQLANLYNFHILAKKFETKKENLSRVENIENIEELSPEDIFSRRVEGMEKSEELWEAYREISAILE